MVRVADEPAAPEHAVVVDADAEAVLDPA